MSADYALYLESGPRMKTTMVHVLDLLGCVANGPTTEAALEAAPGEIQAYLRFLKSHGEKVDPEAPISTHIAAHVMEGSWIGYGDPAPGFAPDFEPLTRDDLIVHVTRLRWLGVEIAKSMSGLSTERLMDKAEEWRSLHEIVRHVAAAEPEYVRAAGLGKIEGAKEVIRSIEESTDGLVENLGRLWELVANRFEAMTDEERTQVVRRGQSPYTALRGLRRALEHPWEHLREIQRERLGREFWGREVPAQGVVLEFLCDPIKLRKNSPDPLSPDVDDLGDRLRQHTRLVINGTMIFELPASLLGLSFYGLWLAENLESDRTTHLRLSEGSFRLEFRRPGEMITVREEYDGAEATTSHSELLEAWQRFANTGRRYLLQQFPLLIHNPLIGPWFDHFPGPWEFPWPVFRNIRLKRVYDPPSPEDGRRILITRYWPRGGPKSAVDEYTTKLAPSRDLVRAFKREGMSWEDYVPRYLEEMRQPEAVTEIGRLAKLAESERITLMCICEDESRCHRSLVRNLILKAKSSERSPRRTQ